jgi:GR25 family glycosyltransferase involved in LPS biosynthesis
LICTDGYVVGNTFGAVLTPLTAPTTVNNASNLTSTSFTAGWAAVTGASGYIVNLYSGATLIKSVRVVSNSADITDLSANTTYTYKVIAIGNATTTSSSVESAASESFSTLTTSTVALKDNASIIYRNNQVICSEIGSIELFNLQGTKLLEVKAAYKLNVDLTNGLYIVRFASEKGKTLVSKIVVR